MHQWAWPRSPHHCPSRCLECRCNIKHQLTLETSYPVMETHASSTPVQLCATCLCLPRARQRKMGIAKQNVAKALDNYLAKEGCLEDPFFKTNPEELSTLCIYPENSWTSQRTCQSKKTLSITTHAQYFYPATLEEHPINNYDIHRVTLAQHLLYHSKGEMLRREQSKGHSKGTRAWQKNIQSL